MFLRQPILAATAAIAAASITLAADSTGDRVCVQLMCINAVVTGSTVQYTMESTGAATMAWMSIGFGKTMANSPMVIMWPDPAGSGSITLSQRSSPAEVTPSVVSSPPRIATAMPSLSNVQGKTPNLTFTIPVDSSETSPQNLIWAFGTQAPSSSAADAVIRKHIDSGTLTIDLTKAITSTSSSSSPSSSSGGSTPSGGFSDGLKPYQMKLVAHGILLFLGFLVFLPFGALLARYVRVVSPKWFVGHWILQVAVAGPLIIAGFALGIDATPSGTHLLSTHKKLGVALFVLYFAQVTYGALVHFVKSPNRTKRPPQNYGHAIFGLLIIGLAYYQVHLGFDYEWPTTTGRDPVSRGVNIFWIVWVVLLPVLYFAGLALLPKQFKQEKENAKAGYSNEPKAIRSSESQ